MIWAVKRVHIGTDVTISEHTCTYFHAGSEKVPTSWVHSAGKATNLECEEYAQGVARGLASAYIDLRKSDKAIPLFRFEAIEIEI